MKYSTKLSDAAHILSHIYLNQLPSLSSTDIAVSLCTNPSYVRQIMAKLKSAGLIQSTRGQAKPILNREPEQIMLLDIYKAVEGNKPLLHLDTHINPNCNVGVYIQYSLKDYYEEVQKVAENKMAQITLADIIKTYDEKRLKDQAFLCPQTQ